MEFDQESIESLRGLVDGSPQKVVVVSHANPDGDAIGSSLAWGSLLKSKGHEVTCIVPNKYPYFLDWMLDISQIRVFKEDKTGALAAVIREADLIFCLDFNQIERLEGLSETILSNTTARRILIDHHLDPPTYYDLMFSCPHSSSTAFMVYNLIERVAGTDAITVHMGEALYVGMMTDTGNFSFSNLSSDLFRAVAVLVDKGVDIPYVNSSVYNSFTEDRVRLLGYAINKMTVFEAGAIRAAYIGLRENEVRRFKFQPGDSEGFVNYPLTIKGLSVSAMFLETRHFIRVSLRSRGDIDVSTFARLYFQGGGHKNASGGKSYVSMEETIAHFRKSMEEYFCR